MRAAVCCLSMEEEKGEFVVRGVSSDVLP